MVNLRISTTHYIRFEFIPSRDQGVAGLVQSPCLEGLRDLGSASERVLSVNS